MPTRRYFSNFAPRQTLANSIGSADTTCQIAGSFAGWPTQFPFYATLGYGLSSAEIVSVTNIVGTTATIARAQNGSVAVAHPAGETMDQTAIAQDFDEANAHTSANSGVHGVTGHVVGDTDAQTLTNKTLTAPTINGGSVSGATSISTGTLTVSGAASFTDGLPEVSTTDWNAATLPGLYTASSAAANAPSAVALSGLVAQVGSAIQQIVWDGKGNEWRRVDTGTWSAWQQSKFSSNEPSFTAYMSTAQPINNNAATQLKWDTVSEDNYNGFSTTTGAYTIPTGAGGRWMFTSTVAWAVNSTGDRASEILGTGIASWSWVPASAVLDGTGRTTVTWLGRLAAGVPVAIAGYQTSGAALNTATGLAGMYFSGQRLGN